MTSAKDYEQQVQTIITPLAKGTSFDSVASAKLYKTSLTQIQKQLRLVKKDIGLTKKAINSSYTSEKTKVGKGLGSGIAKGIFGAKATGSMNASAKDNIRRKQLDAIQPYDAVSQMIDRVLLQIDQTKIQTDTWIAQNSQ